VFTLARTANLATQIVVNLAWSGTAVLGTDYTVTASGATLNGNTLILAPGTTSATLIVTPVNDTLAEMTETVILAVTSGTGYTVGSPATQTGSILDNDLPTVSVADASVTEGNTGSKTVAVTVTLSGPKSSAVTVAYTTVAGTATAGTDYTTISGTLTFAAGVTSQTINVTIKGDKVKEPNETFQVVLSNPSGATLGTSTATVTILDDEKALMAAAPAGDGQVTTELTSAQLESVVAEAKAFWLAVNPSADMSGITFSIAEMDGQILGVTSGFDITLDATAGGYGWYVDSTPKTSRSGQMDLLTAVTHELGHALGLDHDDESAPGVMSAELEAGVRYVAGSDTRIKVDRERSYQPINIDWDKMPGFTTDWGAEESGKSWWSRLVSRRGRGKFWM
jgi:hypothetical protein